MTETANNVPGRNEPDPDNLRMRSWQGGTDNIPDYWDAEMKYPPGFVGTGRMGDRSPSTTEGLETGREVRQTE